MNTFGVGEVPTFEQLYERLYYATLKHSQTDSPGELRFWSRMIARNLYQLTESFESRYALASHDLSQPINESTFALSGLRLRATCVAHTDIDVFTDEHGSFEFDDSEQEVNLIYSRLMPNAFQISPETDDDVAEFIGDVFVVGLNFDRQITGHPGPRICHVPMEGLVVLNRVLSE